MEYELGEGSPLARLYDLDACVLFLGTDYATCTALHLAEYRTGWPGKSDRTRSVPIRADGERRWAEYRDVRTDDTDFPQIGAAFDAAGGSVQRGSVGNAESRLISMRLLVEFGLECMKQYRGRSTQ